MRVHGESLIPVTPVYSFYICTAALPSLMCSLDGAAMSSNINSINKKYLNVCNCQEILAPDFFTFTPMHLD